MSARRPCMSQQELPIFTLRCFDCGMATQRQWPRAPYVSPLSVALEPACHWVSSSIVTTVRHSTSRSNFLDV
jgi:hypothetical protein